MPIVCGHDLHWYSSDVAEQELWSGQGGFSLKRNGEITGLFYLECFLSVCLSFFLLFSPSLLPSLLK